MRRFLAFIVLAFSVSAVAMPHTVNVTIGATTTKVLASGDMSCKYIVFQNNAAHAMAVGDSSVNVSTPQGIVLAAGTPGGSYTTPITTVGNAWHLNGWYVSGTQNDTLQVTCEDGQ